MGAKYEEYTLLYKTSKNAIANSLLTAFEMHRRARAHGELKAFMAGIRMGSPAVHRASENHYIIICAVVAEPTAG